MAYDQSNVPFPKDVSIYERALTRKSQGVFLPFLNPSLKHMYHDIVVQFINAYLPPYHIEDKHSDKYHLMFSIQIIIVNTYLLSK